MRCSVLPIRRRAAFSPLITLAVALVALTAAGCKRHDATGPEETYIPPDLVQRQVISGSVNLCVSAPPGDYVFAVSAEGGVTGGTMLVTSPVTIAAGQCKDLWQATSTTRNPDPATVVTITGGARPTGVAFDHVSAATTYNTPSTKAQNTATFNVNYYHGAAVTFFYIPATR